MPSNRALARIRDYNCSPSRGTSRNDNASSAREANDSARSNRKGGGHVDDQSRRHRSKSKNTDRDSTPTYRRKRNNDSNATISNSKDSRPKNRPTSSAAEAEVSRTVTVPVQESRSVERGTEQSRTDLEAVLFLLMKVGPGGRELAPFHLRLGEKVQLHVSLNVLGLGVT